jgi:hypothetical protein
VLVVVGTGVGKVPIPGAPLSVLPPVGALLCGGGGGGSVVGVLPNELADAAGTKIRRTAFPIAPLPLEPPALESGIIAPDWPVPEHPLAEAAASAAARLQTAGRRASETIVYCNKRSTLCRISSGDISPTTIRCTMPSLPMKTWTGSPLTRY